MTERPNSLSNRGITSGSVLTKAGRFLLHPATVFAGVGFGVYLGVAHKEISGVMQRAGGVYLALLQMCILPLIIAAVTMSVGRLLQSGQASLYLRRIVVTFFVGMLLASSVGLLMGWLGHPGRGLEREQKAALGREIVKSELLGMEQNPVPVNKEQSGLWDFASKMIPGNVFESIAEGRNLPVLFFCLILGAALGLLRNKSSGVVLDVADACYEALLKVIGWFMYGLPVGLCCLLAGQIGSAGTGIFIALLRLILFIYAGSIVLLLIYFTIISIRAHVSFGKTVRMLRKALIVSLGTSNSYAALPFTLESLHRELRFRKSVVDLVMPLGTTMNPHGNALCFAIMGVFMAQLYDVSLGQADKLVIVVSSSLAGVSASAMPGPATFAMMSIVLDNFALPVSVCVVLLTAINPIIDPILTAVNVFGNCASTSLIAPSVDTASTASSDDA